MNFHASCGPHQWLPSVAPISGPHQWPPSVAPISGPHQWPPISGPHQWPPSVAPISGPHQWPPSVAPISGQLLTAVVESQVHTSSPSSPPWCCYGPDACWTQDNICITQATITMENYWPASKHVYTFPSLINPLITPLLSSTWWGIKSTKKIDRANSNTESGKCCFYRKHNPQHKRFIKPMSSDVFTEPH